MISFITTDQIQEIEAALQSAQAPIILVVEPGCGMFSGLVQDQIYGYRVGIETPGLREMIRDFREYESTQGRTPLVFIDHGLLPPETMAINAGDSALAEWVVHSTDAASGESILRTGHLYSARRLQQQEIPFRPFGRKVLGEPADYYDLINLAPVESYGPEIVVASKQHGRFCSEHDAYQPGIRLYLSVPSLRKQPGYVRFMGGHAVCGSLCLDQVIHHVVKADDFATTASWTPALFTNSANQMFSGFLSKRVKP